MMEDKTIKTFHCLLLFVCKRAASTFCKTSPFVFQRRKAVLDKLYRQSQTFTVAVKQFDTEVELFPWTCTWGSLTCSDPAHCRPFRGVTSLLAGSGTWRSLHSTGQEHKTRPDRGTAQVWCVCVTSADGDNLETASIYTPYQQQDRYTSQSPSINYLTLQQ